MSRHLMARFRRASGPELTMNWTGDEDGGHEARSEVGDLLQTSVERPTDPPDRDGRSRIRFDLPPLGWGYGIWTYEPFDHEDGEPGNHRDNGWGDGDHVWQADSGDTVYRTHDEAKAAAEAHYHSLDHHNRSAPSANRDSGVDYDSLLGPTPPLDDDYGDIFGDRP